MSRINIACRSCGRVHDVPRTNDIPAWVLSMWCNWCPACEDTARDYYEEGYIPEDEESANAPQPIPVGDNQLTMPFIFDELNIKNNDTFRKAEKQLGESPLHSL